METCVVYSDFNDKLMELGAATFMFAFGLIREKDLKTNIVYWVSKDKTKSQNNSFYARVNQLMSIDFMRRVTSNVYMINPEASPTYTKTYDEAWEKYAQL